MKGLLFAYASALFLASLLAYVQASSVTPCAKKAVIIDTDANIDDFQALFWLLKRPDIDIKAITVTGTGWATLSGGLTTVFNMLAWMGREDIPVTWGSPYALYEVATNNYDCIYSRSVPQAPTGKLWSDTLVGLAHCFPKSGPGRYYNPNAPDAVTLIAQILGNSSTPIDILELGPATTIATLLTNYPALKSKIGRFVFSGGAVYVGGNLFYPQPIPNAYAEYNAYGDPEALAQVILSGVDTVLVPLDATERLIVNQTYLDWIKGGLRTPEANWVYSLLLTLQTQMGPVFNSYSLWDPFAASIFADQNRYASSVATVPITVITQAINASEAGRTKPDPNGTPVTVVIAGSDVIFTDLFHYYNTKPAGVKGHVCVQTDSGVWY